MARKHDIRLMTNVARLYHEWDLRQPYIAARLNISQATVSRLLKRAQREGIIRITVNAPAGTFPELEESLQRRYGLGEAVVTETVGGEDQALRDIGSAAAHLLETTLNRGEVVGLSSWSATLLSMIEAMHPVHRVSDVRVVQLTGGVGNPSAEAHATQLTRRLAELVRGEAVFLPAPGVASSRESREELIKDEFVDAALKSFEQVSLAFVGIGAIEQPSPMLLGSGNSFSAGELEEVRSLGAVGDTCLHFFDGDGEPVFTALDERVIGMSLEQLKGVERVVGVAGGKRKLQALRGALNGGLIDVLITDHETAALLLAQEEESLSVPGGALNP